MYCRGNISPNIFSNSEAKASELLKIFGEMFPSYKYLYDWLLWLKYITNHPYVVMESVCLIFTEKERIVSNKNEYMYCTHVEELVNTTLKDI